MNTTSTTRNLMPDLMPDNLSEIAPLVWWWLSFVDESKSAPPDEQVPGGGGFLGCAVVQATNIGDASSAAWRLGCNPGGQVAGIPLGYEVPERYANRLLTLAEVEQWEAEEADA